MRVLSSIRKFDSRGFTMESSFELFYRQKYFLKYLNINEREWREWNMLKSTRDRIINREISKEGRRGA